MAVKTKNPMQSPLGTAKGRGSSRHGTDQWIAQHIAALALIPLFLYTLGSFVTCVVFGSGYESARAWLQMPVNGLGVILLLVTALFHGTHAVQSGIVEDYIHHPAANLAGMIALKFMGAVLCLTGLWAVLKVMLGA